MPRGDRSGPMGRGPLTGRGVGLCAGYKSPGFMNARAGRTYVGRGLGRRMSRYAWLIPACGYLANRWRRRRNTR